MESLWSIGLLATKSVGSLAEATRESDTNYHWIVSNATKGWMLASCGTRQDRDCTRLGAAERQLLGMITVSVVCLDGSWRWKLNLGDPRNPPNRLI
jgi:hypothetical protein